jgi:hypothetical protein
MSPAPSLTALVERLESLWIDPETSDIVALSKLVEERQEVLTAIQNSDTGSLGPEARAALAARLMIVRDRNDELLTAVRRRCDKVLEALEAVVVARTAARGYRTGEETAPSQLDRIA